MQNFVHVRDDIYKCLDTLKYFKKQIVWEFGTLTAIYDPYDPPADPGIDALCQQDTHLRSALAKANAAASIVDRLTRQLQTAEQNYRLAHSEVLVAERSARSRYGLV